MNFMNINLSSVKCPFCNKEYVNNCSTVSASLIYLSNIYGSYMRVLTKDCKYYYNKNMGRIVGVTRLGAPSKVEMNNIINNHPESFILYMCKCPSCGKVFSFIIKKGSQYYKEEKNRIKYVHISPISLRANIYGNYVPKNIRQDYKEACNILNLSPQASATLSRRVLEEIINDYFNIPNYYMTRNHKKRFYNLKNKIDMLNNSKTTPKLDSRTIKNLDDLRTIGNAGAHMNCRNNEIIPVKKNEASNLIKMVEILIEKTYIERHNSNLLSKKLDEDANNHK